MTTVTREIYDGGSDWLGLGLPLGSLGRVDARVGAYPFGGHDDSRAWREPIDLWMTEIAEAVAIRTGFEVGMIGFDAYGEDDGFDGEPASHPWITYLVPSPSGLARLAPRPWTDSTP